MPSSQKYASASAWLWLRRNATSLKRPSPKQKPPQLARVMGIWIFVVFSLVIGVVHRFPWCHFGKTLFQLVIRNQQKELLLPMTQERVPRRRREIGTVSVCMWTDGRTDGRQREVRCWLLHSQKLASVKPRRWPHHTGRPHEMRALLSDTMRCDAMGGTNSPGKFVQLSFNSFAHHLEPVPLRSL